jgi:hypothetical protein
VGGPSSIDFIYFWGSNEKQRSFNGQGGAQRPVLRDNELTKTGARSARARTRGQNLLVIYNWLESYYYTPKKFFQLSCTVAEFFPNENCLQKNLPDYKIFLKDTIFMKVLSAFKK